MEPDTEYLFDQRVVNRNIEQKLITADEKQAFIDSLEDCADRAAQSDTRFMHTNGEDDYDDDDE